MHQAPIKDNSAQHQVPSPFGSRTSGSRSGRLFRSEFLRCLESLDREELPFSPHVVETARQVIQAADRALLEVANERSQTSAGEGSNSETNAPKSASQSNPSGISEKSVGDFVTALDLSLDRHLTQALSVIKEIVIVSEEGSVSHDLGSLPEAWLVDPLDATTAYICGEMSLCGPMVAYLQHGVPIFSVMFTLDGATLAIAEQGKGAGLLNVSETNSRWSLASDFHEIQSLKDGCLLFNPQSDRSRSHAAFDALQFEMRTGAHALAVESRIPHSMAALALGKHRRLAVVHDNCAEFPKQMAWDVLPVKLWVEERGGVYWGIDGEPYDILRPMPIIVATRPDIARRLIGLSKKADQLS